MSASSGARSRISVHNLTYFHPDDSPQFEGVSFALELRRYGLTGANGSGKSTLMRLLFGELQPTAGRIEVPRAAYVAQHHPGTDTLSGGERVRAALERALASRPQWLLLDEPTNHLDEGGRRFVYELIRSWEGGLLVASHDRRLLELVDEIVEVRERHVLLFGFNFSEYLRAREAEQQAALRAYESAKARADRERRDLREALERSTRKAAAGRKRAITTGMDKMARGAMERAGQQSAAKSKALHTERVHGADSRAAELRTRIRLPISLAVDLEAGALPRGKIALAGEFNPVLSNGTRLWQCAARIEIAGPARIHLAGPNGAGKTLLLRLLADAARVPAVYFDQHLSLLPRGISLAEAMREFAPLLAEHERRMRLGRLGFEHDLALRRVDSLSGGERVRAAFGMLFAGSAPQLLLLDEPTNNLDADAVDEFVSALCGYRGALLVVSHERAFVERIALERTIHLPPRANAIR